MNRLIVYTSSTGFTKQYAEWIAEKIQCEACSIKEVTQTMVETQDQIIYGGWIMGGMVNNLDKMRQMNPKNLVVYAVGSTPENLVDLEAMKSQNHLENIPFYYMVGGFRFKKLNFMVKGMLKMMKKSVAKKDNKTPQEQFMADYLGTDFDSSDRKYIVPLIDNLAI